jgi:hypothetical protein
MLNRVGQMMRRRALIGGGGGGTAPQITSIAADGWRSTYAAVPPRTYLTSMDWMSGSPVFVPRQVTRRGFTAAATATNYVETYWDTKRIRDPASPGGNVTDGDNGGGGFIYSTNQVALSGMVYQSDIIENCTTNNSTRVSPKPRWGWTSIDNQVIGNTVLLSGFADHRDARGGRRVACVKFKWDDGVIFREQIVADPTLSSIPGQQYPFPHYEHLADTSGMTNGVNGKISCYVEVYPWIATTPELGKLSPSVLDTAAAGTVTNSRTVTFRRQVYRKDNTRFATPVVCVVNEGAITGPGNEIAAGTAGGIASTSLATANANPVQTIAQAKAAILAANGSIIDGGIIYIARTVTTANALGDGTSGAMNLAGLTITRHPLISRANAQILSCQGSARLGASRDADVTSSVTHLVDLDLFYTLTDAQIGGATGSFPNFINFRNCVFNLNGRGSAIYTTNNLGSAFYGSTLTNGTGLACAPLSGTTMQWVGGNFDCPGMTIQQRFVVGTIVANITGQTFLNGNTTDGSIYAYNKYRQTTGTTSIHVLVGSEVLSQGVTVVGNEYELTGTASAGRILSGFSQDNASSTVNDLVMHNNTIIGQDDNGKNNDLYDESGATNPPQAAFTGSIAGNTLTITIAATGTFAVGQTVCRRTGAAPQASEEFVILSLDSGTLGAVGSTYTISGAPQTLSARAFRTAYATDTLARNHGLISIKGNIFEPRRATKGDLFVGVNPYTYCLTLAQVAARQGNWAYAHGVDCHDNVTGWITNFIEDYQGINSVFPGLVGVWSGTGFPGASRLTADNQYVNWRAATATAGAPVAGAGGGDYRLTNGHPGINRCQGRVYTSHDLAGQPRVANTNNSAGAYR